ncbi:hypothetical protein L5B97_00315 [Avibacterium sp. 20-15]|uniref:hypothetical protein n=1 Tax=unclassified Avibacterium TaxID=2685287 RepID=UPI00202603AC|nr:MULTISPECIES: hypothetical protein [unclassified Avibacterium]MCW9731945.1 hypothetical protein [Avibacterium sp. 20-15]URL04134.1 hypothetical protein L4F93_11395 [Avibacterium sp. 20-132]
MAYINQQMKKEIMAEVKKVLPQGWKVVAKINERMELSATVTLPADVANEMKTEAKNKIYAAMNCLNLGVNNGDTDLCTKRYFTSLYMVTA